MDALVLDNVCKTFGAVRAVDALSARVPAGSIYGFLGPNGAGKTTTLRMIMNIICPDSGTIEILGKASAAQARNKIGYMPEERGLYRKMTVQAVVAYFGAIRGMKADDLAREIPKWLEMMDLTKWASRKVEELSKGM
ncbi:ATP-binding cassette domain-containing protein, partial [Candidatus Sumerlaeota bacterium]|nr:ATP-binding cassette domain-containing protein [Candidatus Sumerlaeota bacterium]